MLNIFRGKLRDMISVSLSHALTSYSWPLTLKCALSFQKVSFFVRFAQITILIMIPANLR